MHRLRVVKGSDDVGLDQREFRRRFRERFADPAFAAHDEAIETLAGVAWSAYHEGRKAPRTRKAGPEYADPDYELSLDWLAARDRIRDAQASHDDPIAPARVLVISGSPRSDQTCPGEISKSTRLTRLVRETIEATPGFECDMLDLSQLAAEYGKQIHPCKSCVSTAMPLCHWPCSCYPNHGMGQAPDLMADIYPRWVAAHGIAIVTPVHWHQVPSTLKLMIDRLVCADGGNPDPSSTSGKDPKKAKALELADWPYPKHLAGRAFALVVHGDASGIEATCGALAEWLATMGLVQAGHHGTVARFVGYLRPYATSHDDYDADEALHDEVRNTARALVRTVQSLRLGRMPQVDEGLVDPRPK
jgi:multimeric flavodoxin WrbA